MTPRGVTLPTTPDPTTGEVWQAAFGLENSVVNFFRSVGETAPLRDPMTGQIPNDPDPNMWIETLNFRGSKYEMQYMDSFVGVNSIAQARLVMSRIDREEQYRATLSRGGATSFVANLAAGFLSPTSLIPIAGWYGAVARAGVGARALAGASAAALSGAGAVALDEAVLQGAQVLRTPEESALNIAGGAVLAGILGAAAGALTRPAVSALGRSITAYPATRAEEAAAFEATIAARGAMPASAGAAATAEARGTGEMASAMGLEKVLNWTDPLIRTVTSESQVTRNIVRDLAENPNLLAENYEGIATSLGGAVETIAKTARGPMEMALREADDQYLAYRGGRFRAATGAFGVSGGQLTYTQFKYAVTDALLAGDVHAITEVQNAAKAYRQAFDRLRDEAIAANVPGFKEAVEAAQRAGIDAGYIYRLYDTGAIARNRTKFVDILTQHFISKQEGANRAIGAIERTAGEKRFEADLARGRMLTEVQSAADRRKRLRDQRRAAAETERAARKDLTAAERARDAEAMKAQRAAEREQSAVYRALLRDLKRGRTAERAVDLMAYLRQIGGVRVSNLDALGRVKSAATRGVELKAVIDGARNARIITRDGLDLDEALTLVTNTGYLPPDATLDDLVAAIDESLKGTPRYSVVDDAVVAEQARLEQVMQELDRAGLDPKEMTVADLMAFFEAKLPDGAAARSPEVQKIAADIDGLAQRFDEAALTLDDLESAIKAADEFAPEVAETAKALRLAIREAETEARKLVRDISKRREFADLTPDEIRSAAEEVTDTIMGNSPARMMTPADIVAGPRGPLKERTLQIPTRLIREFVERDPTVLIKRATQTMATDTALVKKFGSTDLVEQVRQINDDANARIAAVPDGPKAEKQRKKLDDARKADIRDITAMRDRLRGNYALPSDPDGLIVRAGRVIRNLNYLRLLGGQTVSSLTDPAKIVFTHGLTRTLKTAWSPLVGGLSTLKMAAKEVELAGAAVGLLRDDRLMSLSDIMDAGGKASRFERGLSAATGAFGVATLMTPWNGVLKRLAGIITQTRTLQAIERVVNGTATPKEVAYLASGGIDPNMAGRIWTQFEGRGPRVGFSDADSALFDLATPGGRSATVGNTSIDYSVRGDVATVSMVRTAAEARGQGSARAAMNALVREADAAGVRLALTPEPVGSGSKARLTSFYRSLGFAPNRGRSKDFAVSEGMIREPRRAAFSDAVDIAAQTDTAAFKRWFGDSKVVDESGRPLRVFHGTTSDFDVFATGTAPSKTGNVTAAWGAFFTANAADSARYATQWGSEGGRVIPTYLSIKNPFEMGWVEWDRRAMAVFRKEMTQEEAITANRKFRDDLIAQGYDGIFITARGRVKEYVAFDPKQIKSASGNSGAFDPDNPVIFSDARGADEDTGPAGFSVGDPNDTGHTYLGEWRHDPNEPMGKQAQDYVLRRGNADGVEYLLAIGKAGTVFAHGRGWAGGTGMTPRLQRALETPGRDVVIHHNHPSDRSLSIDDIATLALPGEAGIWAHGRGGGVYRGEIRPAARELLEKKFPSRGWQNEPSPYERMAHLRGVAEGVSKRMLGIVQTLHSAGRIGLERGNQLHAFLDSKVLDDAGIIDYRTNHVFDDEIAALGLDPYIRRAADAAREQFYGSETALAARNDRRAGGAGHVGDVGAVYRPLEGSAASDAASGANDPRSGGEAGNQAPSFSDAAGGLEPPRGGVRDGEVWWANTQSWTDRQAIDAFRSMLVRDVDRTIVSPGQEKPLWMSTETGKLIGQFKSFAVASVQRTLLSGLQQRDMAALNGTLLMLGLGAMTYWAKASLSGQPISDDPAKWATEALDYSGLLGWLMEANNISESVTGGRVGLSAMTGERATRYASRGVIGALLGPSFDFGGDAMQALRATATGEWTEGDLRALRKLIPFQNLFYIRQLLDAAEGGVASRMGLN